MMNLILILFCLFSIQWTEPFLCDFFFFLKACNNGLYSDIYRPVSFRLRLMIETTKLYILISVLVALTIIQGHICMRIKKKLNAPFIANLGIGLDEIWYVAITCWSVEAHDKFV